MAILRTQMVIGKAGLEIIPLLVVGQRRHGGDLGAAPRRRRDGDDGCHGSRHVVLPDIVPGRPAMGIKGRGDLGQVHGAPAADADETVAAATLGQGQALQRLGASGFGGNLVVDDAIRQDFPDPRDDTRSFQTRRHHHGFGDPDGFALRVQLEQRIFAEYDFPGAKEGEKVAGHSQASVTVWDDDRNA